MEKYLKATNREGIAQEANKFKNLLTPDSDAPYDEVKNLSFLNIPEE